MARGFFFGRRMYFHWDRSNCNTVDLVRDKIEALDKIYSFLEQNTKSCNAKRRQTRPEKGEKLWGAVCKKNDLA